VKVGTSYQVALGALTQITVKVVEVDDKGCWIKVDPGKGKGQAWLNLGQVLLIEEK
jgi:hypothetical protein